jgi:hypothetical protein
MGMVTHHGVVSCSLLTMQDNKILQGGLGGQSNRHDSEEHRQDVADSAGID